MRYGIVGSRRRTDREAVVAYVNSLPDDAEVISGACRGVDTWAVEAAKARGLPWREFPPDLPQPCRDPRPRWEYTQAYHKRNEQIAAACDVLVAFVAPDRTGGTENTISHARRLGKPVVIMAQRTLLEAP